MVTLLKPRPSPTSTSTLCFHFVHLSLFTLNIFCPVVSSLPFLKSALPIIKHNTLLASLELCLHALDPPGRTSTGLPNVDPSNLATVKEFGVKGPFTHHPEVILYLINNEFWKRMPRS